MQTMWQNFRGKPRIEAPDQPQMRVTISLELAVILVLLYIAYGISECFKNCRRRLRSE